MPSPSLSLPEGEPLTVRSNVLCYEAVVSANMVVQEFEDTRAWWPIFRTAICRRRTQEGMSAIILKDGRLRSPENLQEPEQTSKT